MKQRIEDNEFDVWLESSVPEFLPDDIVKQVTPWKKALGQVLAGFVMTSLFLRYHGCKRTVFSGKATASSGNFSGIDLYKDSFSLCCWILYLWCFCFSLLLLSGTSDSAAKSRIISQGEGRTGFDAVVSRVLFAADIFWLFRITAPHCIVCGVCFCGAECGEYHEGVGGCRICHGYCAHKNS